jgi:F1F0 ATPase subunit 2
MSAVLLGFVGGSVLGAAYFLALWATARRIVAARGPGRLLLASYAGRLAFAAVGFYAIVRFGGATGLLSALAGFMVVRYAALRRVR